MLEYATLAGHAEQGTIRFMVEWDRASEAIEVAVEHTSRPATWWSRLGAPAARRLQRALNEAAVARLIKVGRGHGHISARS
jgi:uncharacterized protein (UPF0548 family)